MAFEPFVFSRTIPPTVVTQTPSTSAASPVQQSGGLTVNASSAVSLVTQLGDLVDTANYLQTLIQQLNPGLGISVDPAYDPDLAMALSQIYNGQTPPAVSLKMYSYQLDAELGSMQVNLAAGPDAAVQANPFQYQALMTANKAFESQMTSGVFSAQSSLLLRRLKSDVISNTLIQQQLQQYPAASNTTTSATPSINQIPAATIDVSPVVSGLIQAHIDGTGQVYASMYQVLAQPDPIASDVASVVSVLATASVPDLVRINSLLQMSQSGGLSSSAQDLSFGLSAFTYPQMLSQSSGIVFQLDMVTQMAIAPASKMSNAVGQAMSLLSGASTAAGTLVGVIRSMKQGSTSQTSGPLAGMPLNNGALSGLAMSSPMPPSLSSLGFSAGIHEVSSLLSFSLSSAQNSTALHQDSFQRLAARVRGDSGGLTQLLAVASSMTSLGSLVTAFIKEQQNGAAIANQNPASQLSTIGRILASSQTGNGTAYTVQSGVVTLTPPAVPTPTPGATAVFAKSGIQTSLKGLTQILP